MSILRLSTLSLTVAIAVITLGYVSHSSAAPKDCRMNDHRPSCRDGGENGSGDKDCNIDFSVEFRDDHVVGTEPTVWIDGVVSDGEGLYPKPNTKDKALAFGGAGGFRFDTNGSSQKINGAGGTRELRFIEIPVEGYNDFTSGADFRFHLNVTPRLVLCSLDDNGFDADDNPVPITGTVPAIFLFADTLGEEFKLLYGCISHGGGDFSGGGSPVNVTRTRGDEGTWATDDTWTIEGSQACLITANNYATGTDVTYNVDAPFLMTITAK